MSEAAALAAPLRRLLGDEAVIDDHARLRTYECDGLTHFRVCPALVVLAGSVEDVRAVVARCAEAGVSFVARGSGTGLSGGALPSADGVLLVVSKLRQLLAIDPANQRAVVEPGVINLRVSRATAPHGYLYAPDPSSQQVCSIGGNVAENAGGPHCLKYGFTTNHVTGLEIVTAAGERVLLGGGLCAEAPGLDLVGAFVGSEGTLGVATQATLRLVRQPEAVQTLLAGFPGTDEASDAVSAIIAAGVVPAAIEMMDRLSIDAAEATVSCGYPADAGAVLLVEVDGPRLDVEETLAEAERICKASGAGELRVASDDRSRALLWKGRKSAFAAMGRISPDYLVQDGVIPRTALRQVLAEIARMAARDGLRVANVFHAGDGNLHPLVLYDASVPGEQERAIGLSDEILELCISVGGSVTGEHGVGVEKLAHMAKLYGEDDLSTMLLVKQAFDPAGLANPGKAVPSPQLCGEAVWRDPSRRTGWAREAVPAPPAPPTSEHAAAVPRRARPGAGGTALPATVLPTSLAELSELLADSASLGRRVLARGAGTKLDWGGPAPEADLVVGLSSWRGIVEHEPSDLVVRVRAGTALAELQAVLAGAGQQLAVDDVVEGSTIGGIVATGLSGPRRHRYGAVRDLLLGLQIVRADGVVARSGGKVVKNVAGFDLAKLFAGSYGTLGVIAEVAFRLHPLPARQAFVCWYPGSTGELAAGLATLARTQLAVSAVELDVELTDGSEWPDVGGSGTPTVVIELEGSAASVSARSEALRGELAGAGGIAELEESAPEWWGRIPGDAPGDAPLEVTLKLAVPLSAVAELARRAPKALAGLAGAATPGRLRGSAGIGVLYLGLPAVGAGGAERLARGVASLRSLAGELGGTAVVLCAPEELFALVDAWGPLRGASLMAAVKAAFDPDLRLAPGRMLAARA